MPDDDSLLAQGTVDFRSEERAAANGRTTQADYTPRQERFYATYRDGYYVVIDSTTGAVVPSPEGEYKKYRDGYLWDYAAVSEAMRLNEREGRS